MGKLGGFVAAVCLLATGCHHDDNNGFDGGMDFDMSAGVGMDLATGGGGGGGGGGGLTLKTSIDLTHVHGFAVAIGKTARVPSNPWPNQAPPAADMAMAQSGLYAIDDSGNLVPISLTTSPGGDMGPPPPSSVPSHIYNVVRYVVFSFDGSVGLTVNVDIPDMGLVQKSCSAVILRKLDGALFCFDTSVATFVHNVQSNGADTLFFGGDAGFFVRVDMGGDVPQATKLEDGTSTQVGQFAVNADGDALAAFHNMMTGSDGTRVYKRNGGIQNLAAVQAGFPWVAPNGHDFYYYLPQTGVSSAVRQVDGSFTVTNGTSTPNNVPKGYAFTDAGGVAYGYNSNGVVQLVGPNADTAYPITGITATTVLPSAPTQQVFFLGTDSVGNGGIVRLDYPAFGQTTVLTPGDYSVTLMSLAPNGDITFTGLRNSDGARILATIPAGTTTVNVASATAPMVTTLTRIN